MFFIHHRSYTGSSSSPASSSSSFVSAGSLMTAISGHRTQAKGLPHALGSSIPSVGSYNNLLASRPFQFAILLVVQITSHYYPIVSLPVPPMPQAQLWPAASFLPSLFLVANRTNLAKTCMAHCKNKGLHQVIAQLEDHRVKSENSLPFHRPLFILHPAFVDKSADASMESH